MRSPAVRFALCIVALVLGLSGTAGVASAAASSVASPVVEEAAWQYRGTTQGYASCNVGQEYHWLAYGHVRCNTWYTIVNWYDGSNLDRRHYFAIGTDNAAWNLIQVIDLAGDVVVYSSGWRSLGGEVRAGVWVPAVYGVNNLKIRAPAFTSETLYCKRLNGSWGAWYVC